MIFQIRYKDLSTGKIITVEILNVQTGEEARRTLLQSSLNEIQILMTRKKPE